MRQSSYNVRRNNWPPLPEQCCFQPCFYQDIQVDIPLEFQKIVRHLYYLWICTSPLFHRPSILNPSLFSSWHYHVAEHSRWNTRDRFQRYRPGDHIHVDIYPVLLSLLVSPCIQGVPFGLLLQLHGVLLYLLLSVYHNRHTGHRGSWLRYDVSNWLSHVDWISDCDCFSGIFTALAKFKEGGGIGILVAIFELLIACGFACAAAADLLLISKVSDHASYRSRLSQSTPPRTTSPSGFIEIM